MGTKFLGLLDIFAGISVILLILGIKPILAIASGVYLFVKGIIFFGGVSVIDMLIAGLIFYSFIGNMTSLILIISALWLLQKGAISFAFT